MNSSDTDYITISLSDDVLMSTTSMASGTYTINDVSWDNTSWITSGSSMSNTLDVKGDAHFEGDIVIKGKSLNESLERIEERLAILRPNEELEERWENLRGLRKAYMELEAEIIEKEKIWDILKK